ncbi:unnamed protein product [Urochloa humidicola]
MAGVGGSGAPPRPGLDDAGVADLLEKLNLTREEGEVAALSDDEEEAVDHGIKWRLLGKALSPSALHISTICSAMVSAWGNPFGLKMRPVGEVGENLFIADFGCLVDKQRALAGSPWMVGRHAVILQEYDGSLKPSEVSFAKMEMWVRILNLPFGWMNERRGSRAAGLVGEVIKVDADKDGDASGPFLRARVAIEVDKPLHRGVFLQTDRKSLPEWFDIQFEKLPFFCFSCGIMGHLTQECPTPAPKNVVGELPYELKLRAPEERKKKPMSFSQAAAESFGSSSAGERRSGSWRKASSNKSPDLNTNERANDEEVVSPEKPKESSRPSDSAAPNKLFTDEALTGENSGARKRKPRRSNIGTLDPNLPVLESAMVPTGIVHKRVTQLGNTSSRAGDDTEVSKKQKTAYTRKARSAAAAEDSPRREQ